MRIKNQLLAGMTSKTAMFVVENKGVLYIIIQNPLLSGAKWKAAIICRETNTANASEDKNSC